MKILHITESFEKVGGLETFIRSYNRVLSKQGHVADILTMPFPKYANIKDYDILLVHFGRPLGALYGAYLSNITGIPYIALLHGHTQYVIDTVKYLQPKNIVSLSYKTKEVFPCSELILKGIDTEMFKTSGSEKKYTHIFIARDSDRKKKEKAFEVEGRVLYVTNVPHEDTPSKYDVCSNLVNFDAEYEPHNFVELEAAAMGLKTPTGLKRDDIMRDYELNNQVDKLLEYTKGII